MKIEKSKHAIEGEEDSVMESITFEFDDADLQRMQDGKMNIVIDSGPLEGTLLIFLRKAAQST